METGQIIQIVVTVVAIIGAGAVALVCDLLKSNNERLRQMNLELSLRREEEQRRAELALDQLKRISRVSMDRALQAPAGEAGQAVAALAAPEPRRLSGTVALNAALDRAERIAARRRARETSDADLAKSRAGETLAEARMLARNLLSSPSHDRSAAIAEARPEDAGLHTLRTGRRNWDLLLKSGSQRRELASSALPLLSSGRQRGEVIPFESLQNNQDPACLPEGFHLTLSACRLLESRVPFLGMVFAIGIGGLERPAQETLAETAREYVRTLVETAEFGCQPVRDRIVIATPHRGEAAQRRFRELARKLSNFEIHGPATANLFDWGGFEANGEPLCEAVSAATEEMHENANGRSAPALAVSRRRMVV